MSPIVNRATEQLKIETHQRPGMMREPWSLRRAQMIQVFVGRTVEGPHQGVDDPDALIEADSVLLPGMDRWHVRMDFISAVRGTDARLILPESHESFSHTRRRW